MLTGEGRCIFRQAEGFAVGLSRQRCQAPTGPGREPRWESLCHSERALQFCGPGEVNVEGLDCKGKREKDGECAERTGGRSGGDKVVAGCAAGTRGSGELEETVRTLRSQRRLCRNSRTAPPFLHLPHRSPDIRSQLPQLGECFCAHP